MPLDPLLGAAGFAGQQLARRHTVPSDRFDVVEVPPLALGVALSLPQPVAPLIVVVGAPPLVRKPRASTPAGRGLHSAQNSGVISCSHRLSATAVSPIRPSGAMEIVGHSAMEMTMNVYGHVNLEAQRNALDHLDEQLS
jgi:hypothetical protein